MAALWKRKLQSGLSSKVPTKIAPCRLLSFGALFRPDAGGDANTNGKTAIKRGVDWGSFDV